MDVASFSAQLEELQARAVASITAADSPEALDAIQTAVLGRKGELGREDLGALGIECPRLADYIGRLVEFYRAHRDGVRSEAMV